MIAIPARARRCVRWPAVAAVVGTVCLGMTASGAAVARPVSPAHDDADGFTEVNLVADRARRTVLDAVGDVAAGAFGQPALEAIRASGATGLVLALTALLVAVALAAMGLRALVGNSTRQQRV